MIASDVSAVIEFIPGASALAVQARVTASTPRPLHWTFSVRAATAGGVSNVSQAGTTDGASSAPLGAARVNAGADGTAELVVTEAGAVVASQTAALPR